MRLIHDEHRRIEALKSYQVLDSAREANFDELTKLAAQLFSVPIAAITLIDTDRLWFKSSVGLEISQTTRCISFCTQTIEQEDLFIVPDALGDARFQQNPLVTCAPNIRFYAGVPLIDSEGFALGSFCLIDRVPRALSEQDILLLKSFSAHAMALFELRRERINLRQGMQTLAEKDKKLQDYASHLADAQRIAKFGSWELSSNNRHLQWSDEVFSMFGMRPGESEPTFEKFMEYVHSDDQEQVREAHKNVMHGKKIDIEHRVVLQNGEQRFMHTVAELKRDHATHEVKLCGVIQDITERKHSEDRIRHLAFYDPLTGLPNRRLLLDRLTTAVAAASRYPRTGALLFLDLDNFKMVNDTLGHHAGDMLLQEVAPRLTNCVRETDSVARVGGDEFIILLNDLGNTPAEAAAQAQHVAEKLLAAFHAPFELNEQQSYITPSIGIALFSDDHSDVEVLLKRADLAMYRAKNTGKNAVRFFDPEMQAVVNRRADLEADLRQALHKKQFELYYQPQVDSTFHTFSCEALLRWNHEQKGIISPAEFIPLAEETGLIVPIGDWVLDTACRQIAQWANTPMDELKISVNVSARQFRKPDFIEKTLDTLARTGAKARNLQLELTESLLIDNIQDTIFKMNVLKEKGVSFSLDDFGTGYSSLHYLKTLPFDQLKIDKSFVRDIVNDSQSAAIAKTIITLGRSLGLYVMAEGVEDLDQQKLLADHQCHNYQGYLFSRPMPLKEFEHNFGQLHAQELMTA